MKLPHNHGRQVTAWCGSGPWSRLQGVGPGGGGAYWRVESGSTTSPTNARVGSVELGSSKKVKLVIRSDVDHIATSIGHVSSSRGKFTSPEYLVRVRVRGLVLGSAVSGKGQAECAQGEGVTRC